MDHQAYEKLKRTWYQQDIPVIFRPGGKEKLKVRVPFSKGNRAWLKDGHRIEPVRNKEKKYWILPKSWFNDVVNKCLEKIPKGVKSAFGLCCGFVL